MTQAHVAKLSIEADAETEVAGVLRTLMRQPWLVAGRDDESLAVARRNLAGLRSVLGRLGWTLIAERDLVRLVKSPPPRLADWSVQAPSPLACCWVFLLAAAAEGLPQQVTIGQLVEAGRAAAAQARVEVRGDRAERRAIVVAVRELVGRGIVEETDGQLESYLDSDDAPVLLTIFHTRLLHLIGNFDATTDPNEDPERWLRNVSREPDAARRMRRRLVDDTCVHTVDLDERELDWLSRRLRGDDGGPLAAAFGLTVERRTEGAAFVVPDDAFRWPRELGDVPFPGGTRVTGVSLALLAALGRVEAGPGVRIRTQWAQVGVDCDDIIGGLTLLGIAPRGWHLPQDAVVTVPPRELVECQWSPPPRPGRDWVFVTENLSVVAAAASLSRAEPGLPSVRLICTMGTPSAIEIAAIAAIASAGWRVAVRADFDAAGIRHVRAVLAGVANSVPWRMTTADYRESSPSLSSEDQVPATAWDPGLFAAMTETRRVAFEEALIPQLLEDLRVGQPHR